MQIASPDFVSTSNRAIDMLGNENVADVHPANYIIRNVTEALRGLGPEGFESLSPDTKAQVAGLVAVAREIDPVSIEELSAREANHRGVVGPDAARYDVFMQQPLQALARKLGSQNYDRNNPEEVRRIKAAVKLAGTSFSAILSEPAARRQLRESRGYFREKAALALDGAKLAVRTRTEK